MAVTVSGVGDTLAAPRLLDASDHDAVQRLAASHGALLEGQGRLLAALHLLQEQIRQLTARVDAQEAFNAALEVMVGGHAAQLRRLRADVDQPGSVPADPS